MQRWCVGVGLWLMLAGTAAAQAPEVFRDWEVVRGPAGCIAATSVGLRDPASGLATVALVPRAGDAGDAPAVMTVRVPLGAHLASGIAYSHPGDAGAAVGLVWQSCDAQTCLASGGVSAAEMTRLLAGRRILLGFRPLPGARALVVPVSLLGVTAAWTRVRACAGG